ncbi:hypothetical protein N9059_00240 [bacterium]|nr:hypothetical protein [bacterium]
MQLAIITPSYVNSFARVNYARAGLKSLNDAVSERFPMVVVDDVPRSNGIFESFKNLFFKDKPEKIYCQDNIQLIRQNGSGSAPATRTALKHAKDHSELVFIHLDDNTYLPILNHLLDC